MHKRSSLSASEKTVYCQSKLLTPSDNSHHFHHAATYLHWWNAFYVYGSCGKKRIKSPNVSWKSDKPLHKRIRSNQRRSYWTPLGGIISALLAVQTLTVGRFSPSTYCTTRSGVPGCEVRTFILKFQNLTG